MLNNNFTFYQEFYNLNQDNFNKQYFAEKQNEIIKENNNKGIFDLSNRKNEYLKISLEVVNQIKDKYNNLIICGMGGSSLGARAICGSKFYDLMINKENDKKIHFLDNIHHQNFSYFLKNIDFHKSAFLFISKSGKTIETICQALLVTDFYKEQLKNNKSENLFFITEDNQEDNLLFKIAKNHARPIISHDKDVGGRYSCITPIALIPAGFYDIDIKQYLSGAENIISNFIANKTDIIQKGVYFLLQSQKRNFNTQVTMPYLARLYHFNYWYRQLIAESIGKNNKGITPLIALGSIDQHSILQLFLDGPKDKFFTFLATDNQSKGTDIIVPPYLKNDLNYLINKKLGDVIYSNQEATIKTIVNKNHMVRKINIKELDEFTTGEIMMYFMLETIFYAKLIKVDPFNQPSVEEGKKYTRDILSLQK